LWGKLNEKDHFENVSVDMMMMMMMMIIIIIIIIIIIKWIKINWGGGGVRGVD